MKNNRFVRLISGPTVGARHGVALVLLAMLDVHKLVRGRLDRNVLRFAAVTCIAALVLAVCWSLVALWQINQSVTTIRGDALVGVESAIDMRDALRKTRNELVEVRDGIAVRVPLEDIRELAGRYQSLLISYRNGAITAEDKQNADDIQNAVYRFCAVLGSASRGDTVRAEAAEESLTQSLARAYKYNRMRLHASIADAEHILARTLEIVTRMAWIVGCLLSIFACLYAFDRFAFGPIDGDS